MEWVVFILTTVIMEPQIVFSYGAAIGTMGITLGPSRWTWLGTLGFSSAALGSVAPGSFDWIVGLSNQFVDIWHSQSSELYSQAC